MPTSTRRTPPLFRFLRGLALQAINLFNPAVRPNPGFPEETGMITFVTGDTLLFNLKEKRIPVAIKKDPLDMLKVPGGFSLHPQFLPAAAEISSFPAGNSLLQ